VTGDTDLIPAIKLANKLFPPCQVGVAPPVLRHNKEIVQSANYSFKINQKDLQRSQFPLEIVLPNGRKLSKPASW
jgi:hypothetical protein